MANSSVQHVNTKQLGLLLGGIKPEIIHRGLCRKGHYMNLVPIKIGNGRLLWNLKYIAQILK